MAWWRSVPFDRQRPKRCRCPNASGGAWAVIAGYACASQSIEKLHWSIVRPPIVQTWNGYGFSPLHVGVDGGKARGRLIGCRVADDRIMRSRTRIVLLAVVAGLAVAFGVERLVETDGEAIERRTVEMKNAFMAGDTPAVLAFLVPEAEMSGDLGRRLLERALPGYVDRAATQVERVSLSLREIAVDGRNAEGTWTVIVMMKPGQAVRKLAVPGFRLRARIEYRRESDGWKIRHVEVTTS